VEMVIPVRTLDPIELHKLCYFSELRVPKRNLGIRGAVSLVALNALIV
jgi:hypothetical protein